MEKINLEMCGECSAWQPTVKCKKTSKLMELTVSYCETNDKYMLDSTALEEGCIEIKAPVYKVEKEMEDFINENFELVSNAECQPFQNPETYCPHC
jgi:hypothetical protein